MSGSPTRKNRRRIQRLVKKITAAERKKLMQRMQRESDLEEKERVGKGFRLWALGFRK